MMMKSLLSFLFAAIFLLPGICRAQDYSTMMHFEDILEYTEGKNNFDNLLVNGHPYENIYKHAIGHPFFLDKTFVTGDVVYSGLRFTDQSIKFSSYEQELVLKAETERSTSEIVLPIELVDEFTIENHLFRKFSLFETGPAYYQVVAETDKITCLYLWTKERQISDHLKGYLSHKFGKDEIKKYLLLNGEVGFFRNKRTFIQLFPEDIQDIISSYLKDNKISLKKITQKSMEDLVKFCQVSLEQLKTQQ